MADLMNKAMKTNRLSCLSNSSRYVDLHDEPILLDKSISFVNPPTLLFNIPTHYDKYTDLYVNDFISICLDKEVNDLYEVTKSFNIITNVIDLIFKRTDNETLNNIIRNCTLSLRKLWGEGTPSKIKKVLG